VNTLTDEVESKILDAFESIHQLGIVHNDVRSGNVLISQDGSVSIIDFEHAGTGDESTYNVERQLITDMISELRARS
jgi:RIO-like serine/threonine protein kinase